LPARERTIGALTLLAVESGRRYGPNDLELVEALAARAALAVDNARLYSEAQAAIRARDEFLSIASHELRTPLTPLQLHLQHLRASAQQHRLASMAPEYLLSTLDTAVRQVERLSRQMNNLLDVTRIVGGRIRMERESFDLVALVRETCERAQPELDLAKSTLELRAERPVVGRWDRTQLEQVAANLVSNAIKYGAGKPITIDVERIDSVARLVVRDQGIGIAAEKLDRLFGRFERAVSARAYSGLGLGLYIVRQFVEAHGGSVKIQSEEGRGSVFTVELPLGPEEK